MNINQLKDSKYLKKEDVGSGVLLTIKGDVTMEDLAMEGEEKRMKAVLHFMENDEQEQPVKPMVLNTTNATIIAAITGSEETEEWHGHQIVLFNNPAVMYMGKPVGGISVRAPRGKAATVKAAPALKTRSPVADVPSPKPRPAKVGTPPPSFQQPAEEPAAEPAEDDVSFN